MTFNKLPRYYKDSAELEALYSQLKQIPCPECGSIGMLNRHGALFGYTGADDSHKEERGRRFYCSSRHCRTGCGRTASILKHTVVRGLSISTTLLWGLIMQVFLPDLPGASAAGNLSAAHRRSLLTRLRMGNSRLRTMLAHFSRPPPSESRDPFVQTVMHLRTAFAEPADSIAAFQHCLQISIL